MNDRRFDALARSLGRSGSRRALLKGLLRIGGIAAVGNAALEQTAEAARRPTPTPKPRTCPGIQTPCGDGCCCPNGSTACGPDCCPDGQATCCDNACCYGQCYGEELCCPAGQATCNGVCLPVGVCCTDADCADGRCIDSTCVPGTISITFQPAEDEPGICWQIVTMSGFAPNATYDFLMTAHIGSDFTFPGTLNTLGDGSMFAGFIFQLRNGIDTFSFTVGGVTAGPVVAVC